jgi:hypothetical protein
VETRLKTPQAARLLGRSSWYLSSLLRSGKLNPPEKDDNGFYRWTEADIEAARAAMAIDKRYRDGKRVPHVKG